MLTPQPRKRRYEGFTDQEVALLLMNKAPHDLYKKYLRGKWWKKRRLDYRALHQKCELCRKKKSRQVHHVNYTFFNEADEDLTASCGRCHQRIST